MSVVQRITERLFGNAIERAVEKRLTAAAPAIPSPQPSPTEGGGSEPATPLQAASSGAGSDSDLEWRRLSGNSNRLLPIAAWARQVEVNYWLWKTNPLANWIIEICNALVTGNGFSVSAKNPELKAFIDGFWTDPVNNLDAKIEVWHRQLSIFGLQVWPVFVGAQTGRVRLGMVDPAQVRNIYSDPQNAELLIGVQISNFHTGEPRYLRVILGTDDESVMSEEARAMREGYGDGDCFLVSINRVSNDPFGTGDNFCIADWLDEYEEFVYAYSGKARKQNAYIWDVELTDADEKQCEEFARKYPTQSDGAIRVHNQKAKWTPQAPNLQALQMEKALREFRNHILGARNIPEHWYGGADNVNRATAQESNDAMLAWVGKRQQYLVQVLRLIIDYAVDSAIAAGYPLNVPEEELREYEIQVPEATNKDVTKVAAAVQSLTASIVAASSQGWLDREQAVKLYAFVISMIGFTIDEDAVLENDPEGADYRTEPGPKIPAAKNASQRAGGAPPGGQR